MSDDPLLRDVHEEYLKHPDSYEANRDLGLKMVKINTLVTKAEEYILKALSFNIFDEFRDDLVMGLGDVLEYKGKCDNAINIFIQLANKDSKYFPRLGEAYFNAGRHDECSNVFKVLNGLHHEQAKEEAAQCGGPVTQLLHPYIIACIRFGEMAAKVDIYAKARILGLTPDVRAVLIAPRERIVNHCLMDYWRAQVGDYVDIVSDDAEIEALVVRHWRYPLYFDFLAVPDGRVVNRLLAYLVIQRRWEEEGRPPLLTLSETHRRQGWETLRRLGMPGDARFVTLHVREAGTYQEAVAWDHNAFRNAAIADYLPAIEAITAGGDWVVRIGDGSMTPLPPMRRVIDYALSDIRSDWMDVFCCSQCRFLIGTTSGPDSVALAFGVPIVGTNWFPLGYWPNSTKDLFIHKLLRHRDGGHLSIGDCVRPPLPGLHWPDYYRSKGLEVENNTPADIAAAVVEMRDRQDGRRAYTAEDERLQAKFRSQAAIGGVAINARIGAHFLRTHPHLVDEG